jgi:putative N6-adenine-specific DNA methylase
MAHFFVSVQPGHEKALFEELKSFWFEMMDPDGLPTRAHLPEPVFLTGGIQLETGEHLGFQFNLFSKLAGRVLLRIGSFESRYFDQFEKGLSKIDLDPFLDFAYLKNKINVKVESHKSRLNNEKNLIEAVQNVFKKKTVMVSEDAMQTLYIRIDKDRVTLSLDTSGEHLHRRGYSTYRGEAPLRETLAAYMISKLKEATGASSHLTLVDPFAGSGTILFEALSSNRPNLERDFTWLHFKSVPKIFKSPTWKKNYRWFSDESYIEAVAIDKDEKSVTNIKKNLEDFKKVFHLENVSVTAQVKNSADLKLEEFKKAGRALWVVTNPPYGMRLSDDGAKLILENIGDSADGVIVIHPEKWNFKFSHLKPVLVEPFNNQGLKLKLSVFKKS